MPKKKSLKPTVNRVSVRRHRHAFILNDQENNALNRYLNKYNVKNKSKFIREAVMVEVIRRLEQDSPTLFDDI